MYYQFKKITIIIFTTLFLNACVTGGKDVISSVKENVFNSTNDDSNNWQYWSWSYTTIGTVLT